MTLNNLPQSLTQLEAAHLVRQVNANAPAFDDELEYMFKHALVQEAAYQSLLKHSRAALHKCVAETIERFDADHLDAHAALLAMHYVQAGVHDKAFKYSAKAGDAARKVYANQEALALYAQALDAANHLSKDDAEWRETIRDAYANRGGVFEVLGDGASASENYRAMVAFAEHADDQAMRSDGMNHLNTVRIVMQGPKSIELSDLECALDLAREVDDPLLIGRALWNFGLYYRFLDAIKAAEYLQLALDKSRKPLARTPARREFEANVLLDSMIASVVVGNFRSALRDGCEAVEAYRELDNRHMLADAVGGLALINYYQGNPAAAHEHASEGASISRAVDNPWGVLYNEWSLYSMKVDRGEYDDVIRNQESRRAAAREVGFPVFIGMTAMQPALAYLEMNRLDLAEPLCDEAAAAFDSVQSPIWSLWASACWALPRIRKGELAKVRERLGTVWREGDDPMNGFQGFMLAGPVIAEWALADGRIEYGLNFCHWLLGRLEVEDAHRIAGEMRYWRARLHLAHGDIDSAKADFQQAREWLAQSDTRVLLKRADEVLRGIAER